jgi:hypothetical protein
MAFMPFLKGFPTRIVKIKKKNSECAAFNTSFRTKSSNGSCSLAP